MTPSFDNDDDENAYYRKMAGRCVKCIHFVFDEAIYGDECKLCSRFYSDKFEAKYTKKETPCK